MAGTEMTIPAFGDGVKWPKPVILTP